MAKASVRDLYGSHSLKGLLTGNAKATFDQAALDIGIYFVDNFIKVVLEMTEDLFPAYAFPQAKELPN